MFAQLEIYVSLKIKMADVNYIEHLYPVKGILNIKGFGVIFFHHTSLRIGPRDIIMRIFKFVFFTFLFLSTFLSLAQKEGDEQKVIVLTQN